MERIMFQALDGYKGTGNIRWKKSTNVVFANYIDGAAGNDHELEDIIQRINQSSSKFGMEVGAEKTKLMTNKPEISGQCLRRETASTSDLLCQRKIPGLAPRW